MDVLDTLRMYQELKDLMAPEAAEKIVQIMGRVYDELRENVTKTDFRELKDLVSRLCESQEKTDRQIEALTTRMDGLAAAQGRTEKEIAGLAVEIKAMNRRLGGLSMAVGYGLEDNIMPYIPDFAKSRYGMTVEIVDRRNIEYSDTDYDEINIYAEGSVGGKLHYIIGECKAHPGKKDADRFASLLERLKTRLPGKILPLLIGYSFQPAVEKYIRGRYPGIEIVKSYEFELYYRKSRNEGT
jgi:cell division protein FtsB